MKIKPACFTYLTDEYCSSTRCIYTVNSISNFSMHEETSINILQGNSMKNASNTFPRAHLAKTRPVNLYSHFTYLPTCPNSLISRQTVHLPPLSRYFFFVLYMLRNQKHSTNIPRARLSPSILQSLGASNPIQCLATTMLASLLYNIFHSLLPLFYLFYLLFSVFLSFPSC